MRSSLDAAVRAHRAYLSHVSPCDMHVRSVGECFIDATPYLAPLRTDACGLARILMRAVLDETGIHAAAGVGTNLFLAKVALDILAEHTEGRVAALDEKEFRRRLWFHRPVTDIWGIGPSVARRLERIGATDLAGIASLDERTLYRVFGASAEYLIDHAWGQEPCTLGQIRRHRPANRSVAIGRVLSRNCSFEEMRMVASEIVAECGSELTGAKLEASSASLYVGYAWNSLPEGPSGPDADRAPERDALPRQLVAPFARARGKLAVPTSSTQVLLEAVLALYDETVRRNAPISRISLDFSGLRPEGQMDASPLDGVVGGDRERGGSVVFDQPPHLHGCGTDCPPRGFRTYDAEYRRIVLQGVSERIAREGAHCARPHEGRGRQFMPLAALRSCSDMVAEAGLDERHFASLLH